MFRQIYIILVVLIFACPLTAQEIRSQTAPLEFQGLRFGQPLHDDMLCTKGPCTFAQQGKIINKSESLISTYIKPNDITHYNFIEISSPKYDFWENRLVQVRFEIMCEPGKAESCIDSVYNGLNRQYAPIFIKEISKQKSSQDEFKVKFYRTKSGEIIEVHRYKRRAKWTAPFVKIYNKELMDKVRFAANPNYVTHEVEN